MAEESQDIKIIDQNISRCKIRNSKIANSHRRSFIGNIPIPAIFEKQLDILEPFSSLILDENIAKPSTCRKPKNEEIQKIDHSILSKPNKLFSTSHKKQTSKKIAPPLPVRNLKEFSKDNTTLNSKQIKEESPKIPSKSNPSLNKSLENESKMNENELKKRNNSRGRLVRSSKSSKLKRRKFKIGSARPKSLLTPSNLGAQFDELNLRESILELLAKRPYSFLGIFQQLKEKKKSVIESCLKDLLKENLIFYKEYNYKIYMKKLTSEGSEHKTPNIENECNESHARILQLQALNIRLKQELRDVSTILTDREVEDRLNYNKMKIEDISKKLDTLKTHSSTKISDDKMEHTVKLNTKYSSRFKKLTVILNDIINQFSYGLEIESKEFIDNFGVDLRDDLINLLHSS